MITLDTTTKSLEVVLGGAVATTQLPFVASYVDISQLTFAMTASSENDGTTNSTTAVSLVAAPAASTTRKLNFLSIFNVDTAVVVLTIRLNNNSTTRICWKGTLAIGDNLTYTDGIGFKITDANGQTKTGPTVVSLTSGITGILPVANGGTNLVSYAVGDILHATASGVIGSLAAVAVGNIFASAGVGVVPGWTATIPTAVQDNITRLGTIAKNLLFTDATYDIGASGATRPRDLFLSRNAVMGGTLTVNGFGTHSFSASGTGSHMLRIRNSASGTGDSAFIGATDNTGYDAGIFKYSSGFTPAGVATANGAALIGEGPGGLSIAATYASGAIRFYSGGTTLRGQFNPDGYFIPSVGVMMTAWPTTASASNAYVGDNDFIRKSTSSLRYKNIDHYLSLPEARSMLMSMPSPFLYSGKTDKDKRLYLGFGAEEVAPKVPWLATYDGEMMTGDPNYVTYDRITALLVPVAQDHDARIAALESALSALRAERN